MQKIPQNMKSKYRNLLLAALVLVAAPVSLAQDASNRKYQEGVHYDRLVPVQGTSSPPDKIEVAEFFWYGCVYCYRMDAYVEEWKKDQPEEVNFINIPALWDPTMETHARLFLALQAVGELDAAHRDVFRAIHTENRLLLRLGDQERFAQRYGVSADDYRNALPVILGRIQPAQDQGPDAPIPHSGGAGLRRERQVRGARYAQQRHAPTAGSRRRTGSSRTLRTLIPRSRTPNWHTRLFRPTRPSPDRRRQDAAAEPTWMCLQACPEKDVSDEKGAVRLIEN